MLILLLFCSALVAFTQNWKGAKALKNAGKTQPGSKKTLYQFGHADAFVNGLYRGELPVSDLRKKGSFGLGAPGQVDGELTMVGGRCYQSTADGRTFIAPDTTRTPFAFVSPFLPGQTHVLKWQGNLQALYAKLAQMLANRNGMYAIKVSGLFEQINTRAFPKLAATDHTPLAQMLGKQKLFEYRHSHGMLIGYYLPSYLGGTNIAGFHFHYLSADYSKGGHLLQLSFDGELRVELCELDSFQLEMPNSQAFRDFPFSATNRGGLEKVEKGN